MDFPDLVRALIRRRYAAWHFLLLGALLFAVQRAYFGGDGDPAQVFEGMPSLEAVAPADVDDELLYREALRRGLDRSDGVVRQRLIRNMRFLEPENSADDETLYRQALDLGLEREDIVVRRRMVERVRRLLIAETPIPRPDARELAAYLAEQGERFAIPARVRLEQVHFDDAASAVAALDALRRGEVKADELRGDPLPLPRAMPSLSARELAGRLGPDFASRAFEVEPGRWSGPVPSSYGHSLVFVHERSPARTPELDEVRQRVLGEWRAAREAEALEAALVRIRARAGLAPRAKPAM